MVASENEEFFPKPLAQIETQGMSFSFLIEAMKLASQGDEKSKVEEFYTLPPDSKRSGVLIFKQAGANLLTDVVSYECDMPLQQALDTRQKQIESRGFTVEVTKAGESFYELKKFGTVAGIVNDTTGLIRKERGTEIFVGRNDVVWFTENAALIAGLNDNSVIPPGRSDGQRFGFYRGYPETLPQNYRRQLYEMLAAARLANAQPRDAEVLSQSEPRRVMEEVYTRLTEFVFTQTSNLDARTSVDPESLAWTGRLSLEPEVRSEFSTELKNVGLSHSSIDPAPSLNSICFAYCAADLSALLDDDFSVAKAALMQVMNLVCPIETEHRAKFAQNCAENGRLEFCIGAESFVDDDVYFWGALTVNDAGEALDSLFGMLTANGAKASDVEAMSFRLPVADLQVSFEKRNDTSIVFAIGGDRVDLFARLKASTAFRRVAKPPVFQGEIDMKMLTNAAISKAQMADHPIHFHQIEKLFVAGLRSGFGFPFTVKEDDSSRAVSFQKLLAEKPGKLRLSLVSEASNLSLKYVCEEGAFAFVAKLYLDLMQRRQRPQRLAE